ncbi:MAG: hypothetical protein QXL94_05135 [Candidatus Parvarchaeum sp.]
MGGMKANRRKKKYIPLRLQYDVTEGSRTESAHKGSSHGLPSAGDKPCKGLFGDGRAQHTFFGREAHTL